MMQKWPGSKQSLYERGSCKLLNGAFVGLSSKLAANQGNQRLPDFNPSFIFGQVRVHFILSKWTKIVIVPTSTLVVIKTRQTRAEIQVQTNTVIS